MKISEFEIEALRNHYRKNGLTEEQIDEILPALGAVAAGAVRGAAALGGAAARGLAKGAAALGGAAARGLAKGAVAVGKGAAKGATVAAKGAVAGAVGKDDKKMTPAEKRKARELDRQLKPGGSVKLPTNNNNAKPANFKVKKTVGQDVEIENPRPKPGEPKSFIFNKDDLKQQLKDM